MTDQTTDRRAVSFDVQDTDENRPLISAVEADNPEVVISRIPGVVKLRAPGRLVINRDTVEARLGRSWETHEFQMAIVTLTGNVSTWDDDHIVISWGPRHEEEED